MSKQLPVNVKESTILEAMGDDIIRSARIAEGKPKRAKADVEPTTQQIGAKRGRKTKRPGIDLMRVAEVLSAEGLDPTKEILRVVQSGELEPDMQARIYMELLEYCQPKLSRVEQTISGPNGKPVEHSIKVEFVRK